MRDAGNRLPERSAPELVRDGEKGFLVADQHEMAGAVGRLDEIDPARCRRSAEERFDVEPVAAAHERAYEKVCARHPASRGGTSSVASV